MEILAHNKHIINLSKLIKVDKLPHALFFSGKEGIGKKLVALKLAKFIFCEEKKEELNSCDNCKNCHLFGSNNYPDFYYIDCLDKEAFNTENIKKILYSLNLKTFQGQSRFILFDNVENLSKEISNALLKILEEPPKNTHFCLVGSNTKAIPVTITSRCQVWHFNSLKKLEMQEIISDLELNLDNENMDFFFELANGSMKELVKYIKEKDLILSISNSINGILNSNYSEIKNILSLIKDNKENESLLLSLLRATAKKNMKILVLEKDKLFWSNFLCQTINCEPLRKRNVNQGYLFNLILSQLIDTNSDSLLDLNTITY